MSAVEIVCVSVSALALGLGLGLVVPSRANRRRTAALEATIGVLRARRLAYRLTPQGLSDQVAALGLGARVYVDEVRAGMAEREEEIAAGLGLPGFGTGRAPGPALELIAARGQRAPACLPAMPDPINLR